MKVVVADNSVLVSKRLSSIFKYINNVEVVETSHDGQMLMKSLETSKPDVVVLDFNLYDDYRASVNKIKDRFFKPILILILNNSYRQYRKKFSNAGVDYIFDKATEFEDLARVLAGFTMQKVA